MLLFAAGPALCAFARVHAPSYSLARVCTVLRMFLGSPGPSIRGRLCAQSLPERLHTYMYTCTHTHRRHARSYQDARGARRLLLPAGRRRH